MCGNQCCLSSSLLSLVENESFGREQIPTTHTGSKLLFYCTVTNLNDSVPGQSSSGYSDWWNEEIKGCVFFQTVLWG